jgi:hypothetical protein
LSNTLISTLDAPMPEAESDRVLQSPAPCTFKRSPGTDPILWANEGGAAAMKLNGVLVTLEADSDPGEGAATFAAPGTRVAVLPLGEEADWRQNAELVFELDQASAWATAASTTAKRADRRGNRVPCEAALRTAFHRQLLGVQDSCNAPP